MPGELPRAGRADSCASSREPFGERDPGAQPARLPLSTVETYIGRSGSSVRVSYQL